jgi:hypothetical protein
MRTGSTKHVKVYELSKFLTISFYSFSESVMYELCIWFYHLNKINLALRSSNTCHTYNPWQNQAEVKYVSAWHLQLQTMRICRRYHQSHRHILMFLLNGSFVIIHEFNCKQVKHRVRKMYHNNTQNIDLIINILGFIKFIQYLCILR